jgi:hypothetical protein
MKSHHTLPYSLQITALCLASAANCCAGISDSPEIEPSWTPAMFTDRPDTTESPFTVLPNYWQFELETVSVTQDGDQQFEDWGSVNIKYGLSKHADIQLVTPAWHSGDDTNGWSDLELRFKWNLTGDGDYSSSNPRSPIAVALMPYIKFPTASHDIGNGDFECGLIIPFVFAIHDSPVGCMVQADLIRNEDDTGYTGSFTLSAAYGLDLTDKVSAFIEGAAVLPIEGDAETYLNGGFVFEVNQNWNFDIGVNIGLNDEADDLRIFTGMSRRFRSPF